MAGKNPALRAVLAFERELGPLVKSLAAAVQRGLDAGLTPAQAVAKAFRTLNIDAKLEAVIARQMVAAVGIATGASIAGPAGSVVRRTLLSSTFAPDKIPLSRRIHDMAMRPAILGEIQRTLRAGATLQRLAEGLTESGMTRGALPAHLNNLLAAARTFAPEAPELQAAMKASIGQINKLAQGGAPTTKLKAAYLGLVDKVSSGRPDAVAKQVFWVTTEKARFNAERVARTEIARAWGYGKKSEFLADEDVVGLRWELSSRHLKFDICDLHAGANLYGMGAGIYPTGQNPPYPAHPNCLCLLSPVYAGEVPDGGKYDPARVEDYLDGLPEGKQAALLGINGAEQFAAKPGAWTNLLRNWQGQEKVTAAKFAAPLP